MCVCLRVELPCLVLKTALEEISILHNQNIIKSVEKREKIRCFLNNRETPRSVRWMEKHSTVFMKNCGNSFIVKEEKICFNPMYYFYLSYKCKVCSSETVNF